MNIAFWNINKKNLSDLLVDFVSEYEIDILLLAEAEPQTVLDFITKENIINPSRKYYHIFDSKVTVLSSYDPNIFESKHHLVNSPRWNSYLIDIPTIIKLNLITVHFHSKVNWSEDSLALECVNLARDIEIVEEDSGIFETLIIGDFNMNPYESGLVAANGLHALPDLNHISKNPSGRKIDGVNYKYFYNPMWNFFGDSEKPFGTHYYREPGHVSREWNIYDQVIYRAGLSKFVMNDGVKIIHQINTENLITALNRPDRDSYSDHLPILIKLTI